MDKKGKNHWYTAHKSPISEHVQIDSERRKSIYHANGNEIKARIAKLTSGKTDFKTKIVTRDKEGH